MANCWIINYKSYFSATGKEPTATGTGLYQARVEKQTSFIIETLGVTAQAFDIFVTGPSNVVPPNEAIPVRCYQQKEEIEMRLSGIKWLS